MPRGHGTPAVAGCCAALAAAVLLALGAACPPAVAAAPAAPQSLTEALLELERQGLKVVFSSQVVRPDMKVERPPRGETSLEILDELLAPHGLTWRRGAGGTLIVVPAAARDSAPPVLRGRVAALPDARPVAGARVRIRGGGQETISDADGGFELAAPDGGELTLEVRAPGFLPLDTAVAIDPARGAIELDLVLAPRAVIEEELVVTPSRVSLLREEPMAPMALARDEILALPHLGDDFFRALTLLPGATSNDVSAQFHVRGARRDETQILIDGQELYDAYHLKDFDSALSFVAPATLDEAELTTGGFSARYGDRMSGVLDMTTVTPSGAPSFRVGAGVLTAHVGGAGGFANGRGGWIAEARRGAIDLVGRLLGDEDPSYWDAFAKLDFDLGRGHSLRGNLLHSDDRLDFTALADGDFKRLETEYQSTYGWLTEQAVLGRRLLVESAVSVSRFERDRRGIELEEDAEFDIVDQREVDVFDLRQSWDLALSRRHSLSWGWQARRFDSLYDYFGERAFENPLAVIRHDDSMGVTEFRGRFVEKLYGAHASDRIRLAEDWTLELGLRLDRQSLTDESRATPRLNLAWAMGRNSLVRLAWGRFNQSQRPYELQVEDGETAFSRVERSEHRVLGLERLFPTGRGLALRVELYQRLVGNPRPRYENLYEPFNNFPEVEPERVRFAPEESLAEGIEIFVRGGRGEALGWWANYTWASTEDRIDGRWVPRLFDQTHSLNLDLDYRVADRWRINLAWRYHSGWPTTPLTLTEVLETNEDGELEPRFEPVLGALNSDRLASYHRLDLRASRRWSWRSAEIHAFVDLQNVYDRKNHAGFDFEIDDEEGVLLATRESWTGFLPSAGVGVEF